MWSRFWQDFNSEDDWQLPDVAPSRLHELLAYPIVDHSERVRAEWIWRPRPKLVLGLGYFGYCSLLTGGVTLPLVHEGGRFLDVVWLFISFLLIASATVRAIRWRRDYATGLRRLIRGGECR
jgi:hypothetical protein